MNKLTLSKSKAIACLLLMCLFFAQSCRKDSFKSELPNPKSNSEQLIKYEVIDEWLHTNPVGSHLQLDWSEAKQTVIKGKNVVIVPVLQLQPVLKQDINSIKLAAISSYKIPGKINSTNAAAQNEEAARQFYIKHPPKVYFIQGNDKLYTYLLSFTPKNYNSEAGENKIWTGKLNEYNFSGDTIAIQEFDKSKLIDKYLLKQDAPEGATVYEKIKAEKLQSLSGVNDKKTSNIFYWLLNKVESFIGWVGSAFGASYWAGAQVYAGENYGSGWRISSINWSSVFDSGNTMQIDYIAPDYMSAGGDVYNSFYGYADPNSEVVYPHGPNVVIQNFVADYVASKYQLDYDSRLFLYSRLDIAEDIRRWGEINPVGQQEIDFVQWEVKYLSDPANDITLEEFKIKYGLAEIVIPYNGIDIEDAPSSPVSGPYPVIGYNNNRNNTEDLTYGTNHDATRIGENILNRSNDELWQSMKDLIDWGSPSSSPLRQVGYDFINTFKNNTTTQTEITNSILNERVQISPEFAIFLKLFGEKLKTELTRTNGDFNIITPIDMGRVRPIFGGWHNMQNGLTILINDTEQSTVRLESYTRTGNVMSIVVEVTIMDHFGLDKNDALSKDFYHHGFQSWWVLQHRKGFIPFHTKIVSRKTIKITL